MKRVRTKTYSTTFFLVIFAVVVQFVIIFWNLRIRSQVIIDTQAPALVETPPIQSPLLPSTTPKTPSSKPLPLGVPSANTTTLTISERVSNLLSEAQKFIEQGDTSLARNALLEAEKIQPENVVVLTELASLAAKIQNKDLEKDYWLKVQQHSAPGSNSLLESQEKLKNLLPENSLAGTPPLTPPEAPSHLPTETPPANLTPILPIATPPQPEENKTRLFVVGTVERKPLQSLNSKTEFLLKIPIIASPSPQPIEPGKVSIKLYFYEQQADGKIVPSTARLDVSFENRRPTWARNTEILNALYSLPNQATQKNYFGYRMRIYYKGQFQDEVSEPDNLNEKFPMNY